jgi:hypothetical protein
MWTLGKGCYQALEEIGCGASAKVYLVQKTTPDKKRE